MLFPINQYLFSKSCDQPNNRSCWTHNTISYEPPNKILLIYQPLSTYQPSLLCVNCWWGNNALLSFDKRRS
ncbi:hypothetical protein EB796_020529 [Bugula neritina]|uniref:Uncharacterized protein n=1 Tax=Bugula neritina TaxID=10212 RepID=A0A7J7J6L3_BUGNE|nr:hypothetical protein EB796_020529 [Bugula neritina]